MTTREIYSLLAAASVLGLIWLGFGWFGVATFIAGMAFSQVDNSWIPEEEGDTE